MEVGKEKLEGYKDFFLKVLVFDEERVVDIWREVDLDLDFNDEEGEDDRD